MSSAAEDPRRDWATEVAHKLRDAGYEAYFAGGCVRDLLMGRSPQDYDVATNASPEQVREVFGRRRTLPVGASFGVMIVVGNRPSGNVEVATFRSEGPYHDGRHPASVTFTTAEEDAHRRDFTVNGMFLDPISGEVLDFVGGQQDLERAVLRAIGEPRERMREDRLRMLRAVRFAATLDFHLDDETAAAVREMADDLQAVSPERIAQELRKMLADRHRARAVRLVRELGLLPVVLPELLEPGQIATDSSAWEKTLGCLKTLETDRFEPAWAALLMRLHHPPEGHPRISVRLVCRRLKLSNDERELTLWLIEQLPLLKAVRSWPLHKLKPLLADPRAPLLFELLRAWLVAHERGLEAWSFCDTMLREIPASELNPPPLLTGRDLIDAGWQPGPGFSHVLQRVRDAQLDGRLETVDQALALAESLRSCEADGSGDG